MKALSQACPPPAHYLRLFGGEHDLYVSHTHCTRQLPGLLFLARTMAISGEGLEVGTYSSGRESLWIENGEAKQGWRYRNARRLTTYCY